MVKMDCSFLLATIRNTYKKNIINANKLIQRLKISHKLWEIFVLQNYMLSI